LELKFGDSEKKVNDSLNNSAQRLSKRNLTNQEIIDELLKISDDLCLKMKEKEHDIL
jgi:hypothetical protein